MSDSVWPHRPTRLPCPWDSPGKNTGVGCHFLLQCMKEKSEREVAQSSPTLQPHGLQPTRLLCPWDFPGKSTAVGLHSIPLIHMELALLSLLLDTQTDTMTSAHTTPVEYPSLVSGRSRPESRHPLSPLLPSLPWRDMTNLGIYLGGANMGSSVVSPLLCMDRFKFFFFLSKWILFI